LLQVRKWCDVTMDLVTQVEDRQGDPFESLQQSFSGRPSRCMLGTVCVQSCQRRLRLCQTPPNGRVQPRYGAQRSNVGWNPLLGVDLAAHYW
jgi:hypothetical protein